MGEIAEAIVNGFMCQSCGAIMPDHEEPGYPRNCPDCIREGVKGIMTKAFGPPTRKTQCPECRKWVKETGLSDHRRDKHGIEP